MVFAGRFFFRFESISLSVLSHCGECYIMLKMEYSAVVVQTRVWARGALISYTRVFIKVQQNGSFISVGGCLSHIISAIVYV